MISIYLSFFREKKFKPKFSHKKSYLEAERRIKFMLLTKNRVVLPAAHLLNSPLSRKLLKNNPQLLKNKVVVPALRNTYEGMTEYIKEPGIYADNNLAELIDDNCSDFVRFGLGNTEDKIRNRILHDMDREGSILLQWLGNDIDLVRDTLINSEKGLLDHYLNVTIKKLPMHRRNYFKAYYDVLYYVAGANEFSCECLIPQANVISASELIAETELISDEALFRNILLFLISQASEFKISNRFLEQVSLSDLVSFRQESSAFDDFCQKFSSLTASSISDKTLESSQEMLHELEEIYAIKKELDNKYKKAIEKELKIKAEGKNEMIISSLILDATSFVPVWGTLISAMSLANSTINIFFGTSEVGYKHLEHKRKETTNLLRKAMRRDSPLTDFIEELLSFQSKVLPQYYDKEALR